MREELAKLAKKVMIESIVDDTIATVGMVAANFQLDPIKSYTDIQQAFNYAARECAVKALHAYLDQQVAEAVKQSEQEKTEIINTAQSVTLRLQNLLAEKDKAVRELVEKARKENPHVGWTASLAKQTGYWQACDAILAQLPQQEEPNE